MEIFIYLLVGAAGAYLTKRVLHKLSITKWQPFGELVTNVNTKKKVVALTYDDGPHPVNTSKLLDVFQKLQVKATFFVVGKNIEQHPEIIENILAQGHEIGNHSYSHLPMIFKRPSFIKSEINRTDRLLRELGVSKDIHFRSPFGLKRFVLSFILWQNRQKNILWNLDPKDYMATNPESIENYILDKIEPGSIILLHDGGGDRSSTVKATEVAIQQLQQQGYEFLTVSELLKLSV